MSTRTTLGKIISKIYVEIHRSYIGKIKNTIIAHSILKSYDVSIRHKQNEVHALDIL